MSILITGVEMPTEDLILSVDIFPDGTVEDHWTSTLEGARAVQLPPHGDLIDIRTVLEIVMQYVPDDDGSCSKAKADLRELLDAIENAPVVVPAERRESGE